uniref:Transmembrane protein n=1 Tax=Pithovirus LCPAC406 TaxID=2506599 RepID=A0A481ZCX9_9VIRU|nr:MAG: protein of unknown function DUF1664 [Pithovirus LCPAC406]
MDQVKNPAVMGSAIAITAIAGTAVYFTKQTNAIKEDINTINEEIKILKTDDAQEKMNDRFFKAIEILTKNLSDMSNKIEYINKQIYVINETLAHNNMKIPENLRRRVYEHRQTYSDYSSHHHMSSAPVPQQRDLISDEIRSVMSSIKQ